jgi:hypothetical protein
MLAVILYISLYILICYMFLFICLSVKSFSLYAHLLHVSLYMLIC